MSLRTTNATEHRQEESRRRVKTHVRDLLRKANMRNFSIFLRKLDDGKYCLFNYYEYVGSDFECEMAKLAAEPRNRE